MSADETVVAESSPAEPVEVEELSDEQRTEWQKTGELPAKAKSEASPASKPADAAGEKQDASADGKRAESGTAKDKPRTDERFQTLLKERKEARERADTLERELNELKSKKPADEKEKPAASLAVSATPSAPERPKRPKFADFAKVEDYESAMDKHEEAMLEYPAKLQAFNDAKARFEKQQAENTAKQTKINERWKSFADKAAEIYGADEWKRVVTTGVLPKIYQGDPIELYLRGSEPEIAVHLLQYFGLKQKDMERIIELGPREQWKEIEALETAMREELKLSDSKTATKGEPPKKEVTAAKKPPSEVGGKSASAGDEEEAALRRDDPDEYIRLANAREVADRKKGR